MWFLINFFRRTDIFKASEFRSPFLHVLNNIPILFILSIYMYVIILSKKIEVVVFTSWIEESFSSYQCTLCIVVMRFSCLCGQLYYLLV